VRATAWLRGRFGSLDGWVIDQGSIIDREYTRKLGQFDVVYAWGVLHHTGDLWTALDAAASLVAPGGSLFIAVYNDQGFESRVWTRVKRSYNSAGPLNRRLLIAGSYCYLHRHDPLHAAARLALRRRGTGRRVLRPRGMSARHDLVDWVGGYPFEVAKPERVFAAVHESGFELRRLTTCAGGIGCNEFVFERRSAADRTAAEDGAHRDETKAGICSPRKQ
jgi:2-polyprenyl-6-hydroxyphenyl methylase/3-demethylubiquinone-9 3-methyltransferase